ncbi:MULTISPECIES: hypothetical protein [Bacteroidaceae]|uniref:Uncharacterized protein n=2 Tax=Bacteroides TaxID=816 RepID=A0A3E4MYS7_9BACE|nr:MULTISPECIES: hypothetical protein [Bacteroidaceae]MBX9091790.1 hypothetical protein [Bacteroides xylanisolvens]MBX9168615.1 hypothetical protein [Bacteroides xylanisolvens]MCG0351552.1 hypothetical protein [Phocaeicola vulgatus]RGK54853.1 hypothetical protein DXD03_23550 [Bacteroides xylanisolvens]RHH27578.1 hypothetical protein DW216_16990 [Bacteroides uniformis]
MPQKSRLKQELRYYPVTLSLQMTACLGADISSDSYAVGCKSNAFFGNDSGKGRKKMKCGCDCAGMP